MHPTHEVAARVHCCKAFLEAFLIEKALIAFLPVLLTCRQIVGIEPRQVFDGGVSDTAILPCRLPSGGAACGTCMSCCDQAVRCVDDPTCSHDEGCQQDCLYGDSACRLKCSEKWDLSSLQGELQACRAATCAEACIAGPWDCLGHVQWARPSVPATITIGAKAQCWHCGLNRAIGPNEGVDVKVCSIADPGCAAALSSAKSGPDGSVSMSVDTQNRAMSVFLEFHKDGWLDTLLLLNTPPISSNFEVGNVVMYDQVDVDEVAKALLTTYNPTLGIGLLRVHDCNLQYDRGVDLTGQHGEVFLPYMGPFGTKPWNGVAVNLPIPVNFTTRVVARLNQPPTMSLQDASAPPIIATVNMVVRPGAITLAPFVTPTP